jgi:hypothetical protein
MAGITLAQAEAQLALYLAAETKILAGQKVEIDGQAVALPADGRLELTGGEHPLPLAPQTSDVTFQYFAVIRELGNKDTAAMFGLLPSQG